MRFLLWIGLLGACGSPSVSVQICQRADQCNGLADCVSVESCTETFDQYLDSVTPTQRDEYEYEAESCLDHPACGDFITCIQSIGAD